MPTGGKDVPLQGASRVLYLIITQYLEASLVTTPLPEYRPLPQCDRLSGYHCLMVGGS